MTKKGQSRFLSCLRNEGKQLERREQVFFYDMLWSSLIVDLSYNEGFDFEGFMRFVRSSYPEVVKNAEERFNVQREA